MVPRESGLPPAGDSGAGRPAEFSIDSRADRPVPPLVDAAPGSDLLSDPARLAVVHRLLAAGPRSVALDSMVDLAARLLGAASSQISLLAEQQVVAAGSGVNLPVPRSDLEDSLCAVTVRAGVPVVLASTARHPEVARLKPVSSGVAGSYLGVPLSVRGQPVGALCVFGPQPRHWTPEQVSILMALGQGASAELELRVMTAELALNATRLDLALGAASIGSFELDPVTGAMNWDNRLIELFGYDPATFVPDIRSFEDRLHPSERGRVDAEIAACVAARGELAMEYRIVLPSGAERWITSRGRTVVDERQDGLRLVGAAFDSTATRHGQERIGRLLESMTDAFFSVDRDWLFSYVNRHGEALLGRPRAELLGRNLWEEFPAAVGGDFDRHYRRAVDTGQMATFEAYYPAPLDKWFEVRAWPLPDGLSVFFHDCTARRLLDLDRERAFDEAHAAKDRLAMLAEVTGALASTLEVDEAMDRLVRLVVPRLADWAAVTLIDDLGSLRESLARHQDPARADDIKAFARLQVKVATEGSVSRTVIRTGRPVLKPVVTPAELSAGWVGEELTTLLERLQMATLMVVPLQARDRNLGVLALAGGPGRAAFSGADLAVAVDVGRRAGLALDNAQLYDRQRSAAETLQRHLLPALPVSRHVEMRARYRPAAQEAQVGGDFYWGAVQQSDETVVVAIGDVSGHDLEAISWQAQLAPLLRGFAFEVRDGPAEVLSRVDRAMRGLQIDTMATAVLARIEQPSVPGEGLRMCWSNAGHPPPMLLRADGRVETLEAEPELLLGLVPDTVRADHDVVMAPGDTLVLYTDGLIERRESQLEHGLARLRQALGALAGVGLDELCDALLARMRMGAPEDDIALLAVRARAAESPPGGQTR